MTSKHWRITPFRNYARLYPTSGAKWSYPNNKDKNALATCIRKNSELQLTATACFRNVEYSGELNGQATFGIKPVPSAEGGVGLSISGKVETRCRTEKEKWPHTEDGVTINHEYVDAECAEHLLNRCFLDAYQHEIAAKLDFKWYTTTKENGKTVKHPRHETVRMSAKCNWMNPSGGVSNMSSDDSYNCARRN
ncbi:hypothetical protein [Nonomuraea sp. NPDC048826]|uniref:hypothetical protein n=1 Tax=Nonomuraea sp. NPDC048826 TaxID=3364347 RepID=UPI003711AE99